jgi:hypothetical protein
VNQRDEKVVARDKCDRDTCRYENLNYPTIIFPPNSDLKCNPALERVVPKKCNANGDNLRIKIVYRKKCNGEKYHAYVYDKAACRNKGKEEELPKVLLVHIMESETLVESVAHDHTADVGSSCRKEIPYPEVLSKHIKETKIDKAGYNPDLKKIEHDPYRYAGQDLFSRGL